eukprot:1158261-Pelagomonas_calceolata.AAC.2
MQVRAITGTQAQNKSKRLLYLIVCGVALRHRSGEVRGRKLVGQALVAPAVREGHPPLAAYSREGSCSTWIQTGKQKSERPLDHLQKVKVGRINALLIGNAGVVSIGQRLQGDGDLDAVALPTHWGRPTRTRAGRHHRLIVLDVVGGYNKRDVLHMEGQRGMPVSAEHPSPGTIRPFWLGGTAGRPGA